MSATTVYGNDSSNPAPINTAPAVNSASAGVIANSVMGTNQQNVSVSEYGSSALTSVNPVDDADAEYPGGIDDGLSAEDRFDLFGEDENGQFRDAEAEKKQQEEAEFDQALRDAMNDDAGADSAEISSTNKPVEMSELDILKQQVGGAFSKGSASAKPAPSAAQVARENDKAEKLARRQQAKSKAKEAGASGFQGLIAKNATAVQTPKATASVESTSDSQTQPTAPKAKKSRIEKYTDLANERYRGGDDMPPLGSNHLDESRTAEKIGQELEKSEPDKFYSDNDDSDSDEVQEAQEEEEEQEAKQVEDKYYSVFDFCKNNVDGYEGLHVGHYEGEHAVQQVLSSDDMDLDDVRLVVFKHPDGRVELVISGVTKKEEIKELEELDAVAASDVESKDNGPPNGMPTPMNSSAAATPSCDQRKKDEYSTSDVEDATPSKPATKKKIAATGARRAKAPPKKSINDAATAVIDGQQPKEKRKRAGSDGEKSDEEDDLPVIKKKRKTQDVGNDLKKADGGGAGLQPAAPLTPRDDEKISKEDLRSAATGLRKAKPRKAVVDQSVDDDDVESTAKPKKRPVLKVTGAKRGKKAVVAGPDPDRIAETGKTLASSPKGSKKREHDDDEETEAAIKGPKKKRGNQT